MCAPLFQLRHNIVLVQCGTAVLIECGEILLDGFGGVRLGMPAGHLSRHLERTPEAVRKVGGIGAVRRKKIDHAAFGRPVSLTVAAPGGLHLGVKPGFSAVNGRKVHVHTGFDQAGGNDPAGKSGIEPGTDLLENSAAVVGGHQGG